MFRWEEGETLLISIARLAHTIVLFSLQVIVVIYDCVVKTLQTYQLVFPRLRVHVCTWYIA